MSKKADVTELWQLPPSSGELASGEDTVSPPCRTTSELGIQLTTEERADFHQYYL